MTVGECLCALRALDWEVWPDIKKNQPWCQIVHSVKSSIFTHSVKLFAVSNCPASNCPVSNCPVSNCPGVKSSVVSNCPRCQIVRCQIVLVSNCLRCQIVCCVKLSAVSNCLLCQIVLVSKCPRCQIVCGVKLSARGVKLSWCQNVRGVKLSAELNCPVSNCPRTICVV